MSIVTNGLDVGERNDDRVPPAFASALLSVFVASFAIAMAVPFSYTGDDTLFYATVGRHLVHGDGATFNGAIPTNGVQPLWQMVVASATAVLDVLGVAGDVARLRGYYVVVALLSVVALMVANRLLVGLKLHWAGRLAGLTLLEVYLSGLLGHLFSEAHLAVCLLLGVLVLIRPMLSAGYVPLARIAQVGLALGLVMLARLDLVFVAGTLVGVLAWRRRSLREMVTIGAAAAAIVLPYLVWNLVQFGNVLPISGAIKVDLTNPMFLFGAVGPYGAVLLVLAATAGLIAFAGCDRPSAARDLWMAVLAGSAASSLFYLVAAQGTYTAWNWYFVPHAIAASLAGAAATSRVVRGGLRPGPWIGTSMRRMARVAAAGCIAVSLVALMLIARRPFTESDQFWNDSRALARAVEDEVPPGQLIATVDLPGVLAFSSQREFVAMDGLTGDFEFQSDLVDRGAACVLTDLDVTYLLTYAPGEKGDPSGTPPTIGFSSWLFRAPAGRLVLRTEDRLVDGGRPPMTLWRIDPTCAEDGAPSEG